MERILHGSVTDHETTQMMVIPSVTIKKGSIICVAVTYEVNKPPLFVSWGDGHYLPKIDELQGTTIGMTLYYLPVTSRGKENHNIVIYWHPASIAHYKVAIACEYTDGDIFGGRVHTIAETSEPDSGTGEIAGITDAMLTGFIASNGPVTDDPGVVQNGYADEWAGTNEQVESDNVSLLELYKPVTWGEGPRAQVTGSTFREKIAMAITFKKSNYYHTAISPTTLSYVFELFAMNGYDLESHNFKYSLDKDRWEVYADTTLVSYMTTDGWVEV